MDGEMEYNRRSGCWEGLSADGTTWISVLDEAMGEARHMAIMAGESKTTAYPRLLLVATWLTDGELREMYGVDIENA